jgi:hypothetical protein
MASTSTVPQSQPQTRKGLSFPLLLLALFLGALAGVLKHRVTHPGSSHPLVGPQFIRLIPLAFLAFGLFLKLMGRYWQQTFGPVQHLQISSPSAEERIRQRYGAQMNELAGLGFDQLFIFGEGFSVFRVFLIFPALTVITMLRKRENLSIEQGNFVISYPAFAARDKSAFAHVFAMGTKFYTAFDDGTLLISKNFVNDMGTRPGIIEYAREASIADTWAEHQRQIQALEAGGKRINRQTSFQFYSELARKDRPAK